MQRMVRQVVQRTGGECWWCGRLLLPLSATKSLRQHECPAHDSSAVVRPAGVPSACTLSTMLICGRLQQQQQQHGVQEGAWPWEGLCLEGGMHRTATSRQGVRRTAGEERCCVGAQCAWKAGGQDAPGRTSERLGVVGCVHRHVIVCACAALGMPCTA